MTAKPESIKSNLKFYVISVAAFLLMVISVFMLPADFMQYRESDVFAPFWYAVTESGGFIGGLVMLILITAYMTIHFKNTSRKNSDLILIISLIFFTFVFSSGISEFYIKEIFHKPRPFQLYLMEKGYLEKGGSTYFTMPYYERRKYLEEKIDFNDDKINEIYKPVLRNWIYESGYSFPSGHAQISFFFGTVSAFILYVTQKRKRKNIFSVPLIWAVFVCLSRVLTGMHYPADVAAGAFAGMLLGLILISIPPLSKIQNK